MEVDYEKACYQMEDETDICFVATVVIDCTTK